MKRTSREQSMVLAKAGRRQLSRSMPLLFPRRSRNAKTATESTTPYEAFQKQVRQRRIEQLEQKTKPFDLTCFYETKCYSRRNQSSTPVQKGPLYHLFVHFAKFGDPVCENADFSKIKHDSETMRTQECLYFCEHLGLFRKELISKSEVVFIFGWVLRSDSNKEFDAGDFIEFMCRMGLLCYSRPPLQTPRATTPYEKIDAFIKHLHLDSSAEVRKLIDSAKSITDYNKDVSRFLKKGEGLAQGNCITVIDGELNVHDFPLYPLCDTDRSAVVKRMFSYPKEYYTPYVGTFFDMGQVFMPKVYKFQFTLVNNSNYEVQFTPAYDESLFRFPATSFRIPNATSKRIKFTLNSDIPREEKTTEIVVRLTSSQNSWEYRVPVYLNVRDHPKFEVHKKPSTCPLPDFNSLSTQRPAPKQYKKIQKNSLFLRMLLDHEVQH